MDASRGPCLIGTARHTWHPSGEPAPEPLDMWVQLARAAAHDVGVDRDVIAAVDDLSVVHCQSWAYDDPPRRLAERLQLESAHRSESILAGTSPQRLIDAAAERMLRGETSVALVVGGEALATRREFAKVGDTPPWSHPHPAPPLLPVELDEWYLPTEIAHGVLPAWLTFALLDQARWAARGGRAEDRREQAVVMDRLNAVAAANPDAWFRERRSGDELVTPGPGNRMVATPYTKRMTAFMDVDMAAAQLLVSAEVADAWGVPEERRVHLRGWGFARDAVHLGARADLTSSPAMRAATGEALGIAGLGVDDVDVFDLYSCFPSAVEFACDALGIGVDDPRPISVTGGLAYHGGPSSDYMGHSISHLVDRLRERPGDVGMVTGIGMHMTKHVAALWSVAPGPLHHVEPHHLEQRWDAPSDSPEVAVVTRGDGRGTVLAASVVYRGDGEPDHAVAICGLPDGTRCYARSDAAEVVVAVIDGAWVGATAVLLPAEDGTNELRL